MAGLEGMSYFYGSMTGTSVLTIQEMPPSPPDLEGVISLYGLPGDMQAEVAVEHVWPDDGTCDPKLRSSILCVARMHSAGAGGEVTVRFVNKAAAAAAIAAAKGRGFQGGPRYNSIAYKDRGWVRE